MVSVKMVNVQKKGISANYWEFQRVEGNVQV